MLLLEMLICGCVKDRFQVISLSILCITTVVDLRDCEGGNFLDDLGEVIHLDTFLFHMLLERGSFEVFNGWLTGNLERKRELGLMDAIFKLQLSLLLLRFR